jgi:3D (Asp-Asp-Asp) domain-containing protein
MASLSFLVTLAPRRFAVFTSFLLCLSLSSWAGTFTAYGPQTYVRDSGSPVTVTNTFTILNPNTQYTLRLHNGGLVDAPTDLVSSTTVVVNGVTVVAPNDLNQTVLEVDRAVALQAGSNQIDVQVRGAPGGSLSIDIIGVDDDPPVITAAASPLPNDAEWNKSDVTVSFACSDATSGIAICPPAFLVNVDGANQVVSGQAVDRAGNTATASVTINLDKTPPSILAAATPAPNAAGWNNTDVVVTYTCTDSLSTVASCPGPAIVATEGQNQNVTGVAMDVAGNSATAANSISIDKTPPVITVSSPSPGTTVGVASVTISGSVSDPGSGLASVSCGGVPATVSGSSFSCTQSLVTGTNSIGIQAVDNAGNSASTSTTVAFVRPPQITITSPVNSALFNQSPINVTGTVVDPAAQVKVNGIEAPVTGNTFLATVPVQEGISTITAVAVNSDGFTDTASVEVNLDTTPPHVAIYSPADQLITTDASLTVTGLVNDIVVGTVNPQQASVTVNGVAAQVANRSFSAASIPLTVGPNTIHATAVDAAGNEATATVTVIRQGPGQPVVKVFSGNNQAGPIGSALPLPLVAQVLDASGLPVAGVPVVFRVTAQDGTLGQTQPGLSDIAANTDAQGLATVQFRLGTHAGAGNNLVEASATGIPATAVFSASASSTGATLINVDSGNNQFGVVGQALPLPFIGVVTDAGHNRIPNVPVTFTVKNGGGNINGQPSVTVNSDGDGRVQTILTLGPDAGVNNNLVEATFPGNTGFAAAFTATARTPGPAAATTISGVVLDNSNQAIPGVTMRLFQLNQGPSGNLPQQVGTPVVTDGEGQFTISPAPVGVFKLMADGGTATRPGVWPTLEYDIITIPGQNNTVGSPIYLPQLNPNSKVCVTETTGGTLTTPDMPGFSLTIAPGSATFPGGSRTGCVSVTPVNMDKVPMVPGFGQQPRFIVTVQPVGTMFNPPAAMTIPNVDGLPPRAVTEMYSYDHDLATFVAIGSATVSDDGSVIKSDPGVGVLKAGWHCGGNPNTTGSAGTCPDCQKCQGSGCVADAAKNNTSCTLSGGHCGTCNNGTCETIKIEVTRTSLTRTSSTGKPTPGANPAFTYTANPVAGSSTATYTTDDPNANPNIGKITAPANPSATGAPSPGGLAELTVTYHCQAGDTASKTFRVATFGLSCYVLAAEDDFIDQNGNCTSLRIGGVTFSGTTQNPTGLPAGSYCTAFLRDVQLQGSGTAHNGTMVHYESGTGPSTWVFSAVTQFTGADGTALIPFGSVARDRTIVPRNTTVQLESGNFVANDTGQAIQGYRLDVFGGAGRAACANVPNTISVGACTPGTAACPDLTIP